MYDNRDAIYKCKARENGKMHVHEYGIGHSLLMGMPLYMRIGMPYNPDVAMQM